MTANVMAADRLRCREAGMDAFVAKPVDPEPLYATLTASLLEARLACHGEGDQLFLPRTLVLVTAWR